MLPTAFISVVSANALTTARRYSPCRIFGETLYIDDLPSETEAIQSDTPVYDMLGRRVTSMSRGGIYVRDGKKFVYLRHESE